MFDFLGDAYKKAGRICTLLDLPASPDEARRISEYFCKAVCDIGHDVEFRFDYEHGLARVILCGAEECVAELMRRYYER